MKEWKKRKKKGNPFIFLINNLTRVLVERWTVLWLFYCYTQAHFKQAMECCLQFSWNPLNCGQYWAGFPTCQKRRLTTRLCSQENMMFLLITRGRRLLNNSNSGLRACQGFSWLIVDHFKLWLQKLLKVRRGSWRLCPSDEHWLCNFISYNLAMAYFAST